MNETIYVSKKNEVILKAVPGENTSKKVAYLIDQYVSVQLGGEQ